MECCFGHLVLVMDDLGMVHCEFEILVMGDAIDANDEIAAFIYKFMCGVYESICDIYHFFKH